MIKDSCSVRVEGPAAVDAAGIAGTRGTEDETG